MSLNSPNVQGDVNGGKLVLETPEMEKDLKTINTANEKWQCELDFRENEEGLKLDVSI